MKTTLDPFKKYKKEYWKTDKKRKGEILGVVAELTAMHEKSIIRKNKQPPVSPVVFRGNGLRPAMF